MAKHSCCRYVGRFCKKAGRIVDGSAVFWRSDKLRCEDVAELDMQPSVMRALCVRLVRDGWAVGGPGGLGWGDCRVCRALEGSRCLWSARRTSRPAP